MFWKKKEAPPPSLTEASDHLDTSLSSLNTKIDQCDADLLKYKEKKISKDRAMQILKRKKMLESQREMMYNTQSVVDQASYLKESAEIVSSTIKTLKQSNLDMKKVFPKNIDQIYDVMDEMQDYMDDMQEINDVMRDASGMANGDLNDEDLLAEFEALEASSMPATTATSTAAPTTESAAIASTASPKKTPALASINS
jgi:charged multivesicular body protein 5